MMMPALKAILWAERATQSSYCAGVQLILGMNGVIWVSPQTADVPEQANSSQVSDAQPAAVRSISVAERQACARVANCIRALAKLYFLIYPDAILRVYQVLSSVLSCVLLHINSAQLATLHTFCNVSPLAHICFMCRFCCE